MENKCERDINTDGLDIDYDDGVSYSCVECEMIVEELGKPSWSSTKRALITFEMSMMNHLMLKFLFLNGYLIVGEKNHIHFH